MSLKMLTKTDWSPIGRQQMTVCNEFRIRWTCSCGASDIVGDHSAKSPNCPSSPRVVEESGRRVG